MALTLDDKWIWDFWFAVDGDNYHIFYLQADKSLKDPELRHWNVSIGHAVSKDLREWEVLPDALAPSEDREAADSYTTWTGCTLKQGDTWYMFYTGTSRVEDGLVQRVCLATSKDLINWDKHPINPLAELDQQWYDGLNLDLWHDASWRDPWVIKDPDKELYHMYVTCRSNQGAPDGRGAVGYAWSTNLLDWTVGEPLLAPGWFGEMEVPQIEKIGGRYHLFCSVSAKYHSETHRNNMNATPLTGVKVFVSDHLNGPYSCPNEGDFLMADSIGSLYSARAICGPDDNWYLLAFRNNDRQGQFIGDIIDPVRIDIDANGNLSLANS